MAKFSSVFLLLAAVLLFSCKKPALVGSSLLPKGDVIFGSFTDDLTLNTKTVLENALYTNVSSTNTSAPYLLGSMQDRTFGKSYAGIFTQLSQGAFNPPFISSWVVDSAVLCLAYAGKYGDLKTVPQTVSVYQLTESIKTDSPYLSTRAFGYDPTKLGEKKNFIPDYTTVPADGGATLSPMLRIRLNTGFWQSIISSDSANFSSVANFQALFKGLFIMPDTTNPGKGIMYIDMASASSHLAVFYHNTATGATGQQFDFGMNTSCARTNWFKHNYTNSLVGAALNSTKASDSIVYVQAMAGVRTKITIPNLNSLGKILINKAEISISQVFDPSTDDTVFHVPTQMLCIKSDGHGKDALTPDLSATAVLAYHGTKSYFTNADGRNVVSYRFTVTDQLQAVINKDTAQSYYQNLYLINGTSTALGDRIVTGGGNRNDAAKMKLTLIYTKLPN